MLGALWDKQILPLPGNAQAKIQDASRLLLNHVSQMPSKMPMSLMQQMTSSNQPFADVSKKLAVCFHGCSRRSALCDKMLNDYVVVIVVVPFDSLVVDRMFITITLPFYVTRHCVVIAPLAISFCRIFQPPRAADWRICEIDRSASTSHTFGVVDIHVYYSV